MAAGKYSFIIEQGATFTRRLRYTDSLGSPVDLTNFNARMQIRQTVDENVTILNLNTTTVDDDGSGLILTENSGTIDITISALSSSFFAFSGDAVFDVEIYSGSGVSEYVVRILEGRIKLSKNVTRG